ncbi:hypothetical protein SPRG_08915 [Saprolegnia parasitica CBS 223.65]|uniref:FYVE-type domain-containing protein n=1 Tax=Saprolegnia parasitica (strain CBS 223.65) TaxID=695850 RepID=A0A067CGE2_SAPPC|nr:hypothetical protein SPRG_08915 [Saprolegnia parasitica CBS 223.65]KDO25616.1 hypothetical protein SPRG_08915 [Saprolegnia parasitica CBS 223.65]|eukprot:XP_012203649.1 hypothetical protein SPRG_08915 [Saprolegnia parasitica CBS 223.65]
MPYLPLPPSFFRCPPLQTHERVSLIADARDACRDTILNAKALAGAAPVYQTFTHPQTQRRLTVRLGTDLQNPNEICMSAHTLVNASIDAVADVYANFATSSNGKNPLLASDVLDRVRLYELVARREVAEAPLHAVYLQWMALRTPPVIADRDFCYLECHDEFLDGPARQRGFVRSVHSVDAACCPPLNASHGLTRGLFQRSGQVFIESNDEVGALDAYHVLVLQLKGNVPKDIQISVMLSLLLQACQLDTHFRAEQLSAVQLVPLTIVRAQPKAVACRRCTRSFRKNLFQSTKQFRCRMCGHAVCRACHHVWRLGSHEARICTACAEMAKPNAPMPVAATASPVPCLDEESAIVPVLYGRVSDVKRKRMAETKADVSPLERHVWNERLALTSAF